MKASYKLKLEQEQRRLGLTHKELNRYDRKHNDINLIKYLQSLEPKVSAPPPPPANTGFWGIFVIFNQQADGSNPRHMHVYLAYNNVPLTSSVQINSNTDHTFNVAEADRLPLPASILQLKVTFQINTESSVLDFYDGFEITDNTQNPLDEENTLSMLVNENNYDDGQCSATFIVSYEPP